MKKDFNISYENDYRKVLVSNFKNKKGERIIIELSRVHYDNSNKNSLPNLWLKHGYTNKLYESALFIDCEVTNEEGKSYRKYEPTTKLSEDGYRNVINFDWLLEVSEENEEKLLNETVRRFLED